MPVNATVHKIYAPRRRTQGSPSPASVPSKSAAAYGLSRLLVVVAALHSGYPFALRNATAPRPLTTYSKAAPVYLTQTLLLQSFSDNVFAMQAKAVAGTGTRRLIANPTPPCSKCALHAAGTQSSPLARQRTKRFSCCIRSEPLARLCIAAPFSCLFAHRNANCAAPVYHFS